MNVAYYVPHGETRRIGIGDVRNEVWVKSLVDGGEAPVIADQEYSRWYPRWSPDGTRLAYERRNLKTERAAANGLVQADHDEEPVAALANTVGGPLRLVSRRQVAVGRLREMKFGGPSCCGTSCRNRHTKDSLRWL